MTHLEPGPKGLLRPGQDQKIRFFGTAADFLRTSAKEAKVWTKIPHPIREVLERYFTIHDYLEVRTKRSELRNEGVETVIVPVVQLILLRDGPRGLEIFWGKRAKGGLKNRWSIPGGKREKDEDFETAALRELEEEVGMKIEGEELLPLGRYISSTVDERNGTAVNREYRIQRYAIMAQHAEPKNAALDEHTEMRWMSLDEALAHHMEAVDVGGAHNAMDTFTPRALGVIERFGGYTLAEDAVENLREK